ncbi:MAG: chromosome segregation protein SMC, partial [Proteobacteria bacterium]|nr:chromosome segregation protein SMC [Pseudomonadota bacterium]
LNFDDGITGIVGPNGSGKSNVIDAVRWVMGEQNAKHLRGEIATDIIFAGSDRRKPLGMAEVTLIFDNRDQSHFCPPEYRHEAEIALTRRLYIDGEREYFINKKPCRLKDIVGFFATTGLGGRSYSMIQQGQVDRILNAKPEDVREILEEAAGTLIFKARRQAAQKKLESTHENLKRIDDILVELSRQLENLKEQVEKVAAWKQLSGALRDGELKVFAHNFRHFSSKLLDIAQQLDGDTDSEVQALAILASFEARVEELQGQLSESDPELDQLREEISHLREQIVRAEGTIAAALRAAEQGQKRLAELASNIDEDQESLKSLENMVATKEAEYSRIQVDVERLQELIESFQDEVDQVEEAAQVFENRAQELEDEIKNLELLLESNRLRCEGIERDRKRILVESQSYEARHIALQESLKVIGEKLDHAKNLLNDRQVGLDHELQFKQELERDTQNRDILMRETSRIRDAHKEAYFTARARLGSLEELEVGSGDLRSSLQILTNKYPRTQHLVLGSLTDFIAFQAHIDEWAPRAVHALERWSERLIVASSLELNELIRLAHQEQLPALPISIISLWNDEDLTAIRQWAELYDAVPCLDVLRIEASQQAKLLPLLQRLYYLPAINLSEDELNTLPRGLVLFTAQGVQVSSRDELLLNGAQSKGSLSRKTEIEELALQLKESEAQLAGAQNEMDVLEQKQAEDRLKLKEIADRLGSQNQETLAAMSEMQSQLNQEVHQKEMIDQNSLRMKDLELREAELKKELEHLGETRISLGQEKEHQQSELESLQEESASIADRKGEVLRIHQQRQLELAKYETRSHSIRENMEQSRQQLAKLQNNLTKRYEEKNRLDQELEQAAINQTQATQEIEAYIHRREELESVLSNKREQNAGVLEELRVIESRLREARDQQMEYQKSKSKKTIEMERLKQVSRGLLDQAKEKYQVDLMSYEFEEDPNFDADRQNRECNKLRIQLETMGGINMVAVEEYERISKRHEFIDAQKEEVLGSILLLQEAIDEIEETSKEKFMATFAVVNQNFIELFPILFPSGEARLELTSEDALNAGVEIMVRMPGKKPRSMNLYSGGEKALTAISLIFALLKTKPTPFCFLDEVDAPLDEANVGRYNKVLEALSDRFQFVVITHNRRTMEVLDQLYGVTMQEGGVSTVVGVDMKKDLPAHLQKAFKKVEQAAGGATAS